MKYFLPRPRCTELLVRVARIHDTGFTKEELTVYYRGFGDYCIAVIPYCRLKVVDGMKCAHNRSTSNLVTNCVLYEDT